jgi:hypothetical protein
LGATHIYLNHSSKSFRSEQIISFCDEEYHRIMEERFREDTKAGQARLNVAHIHEDNIVKGRWLEEEMRVNALRQQQEAKHQQREQQEAGRQQDEVIPGMPVDDVDEVIPGTSVDSPDPSEFEWNEHVEEAIKYTKEIQAYNSPSKLSANTKDRTTVATPGGMKVPQDVQQTTDSDILREKMQEGKNILYLNSSFIICIYSSFPPCSFVNRKRGSSVERTNRTQKSD